MPSACIGKTALQAVSRKLRAKRRISLASKLTFMPYVPGTKMDESLNLD
jgi:hypothetical protein